MGEPEPPEDCNLIAAVVDSPIASQALGDRQRGTACRIRGDQCRSGTRTEAEVARSDLGRGQLNHAQPVLSVGYVGKRLAFVMATLTSRASLMVPSAL